MIPEFVGANALFIDKEGSRLNVFDLCQPTTFAKEGNLDFVENHQPIVHFFGNFRENLKVQLWRSQIIQIHRCGEKLPERLWISVEDDFAFQDVHCTYSSCLTRISSLVLKPRVFALAIRDSLMPASSFLVRARSHRYFLFGPQIKA